MTHDPQAHVLRCPLDSATKSTAKIVRMDASALRDAQEGGKLLLMHPFC